MTELQIEVIVAMIRAVYGLPAKCVGYMGLVRAEERNNTHTLPVTLQLRVVFLRPCSLNCPLYVVCNRKTIEMHLFSSLLQ